MATETTPASHAVRIRKVAPGPRSFFSERAGEDDPLNFILSITREYGDVVQYPSAYGPVYLVNHPDYIGHVLHDKNFIRTRLLGLALGNGLITSEGTYWRGQRRLAQPAFHQHCIFGFGTLITDAINDMLRRWIAFTDTGQPIEISAEMTRLTLNVIGKALFSVDLDDKAAGLADAITTIITDLGKVGRTLFTASYNLTPSRNSQFESALKAVDQIIYAIIRERRRENNQAKDLLSILLSGRDEETGESLNDRQLRDEVVTLLVAGHETTANMLSWTWYLLSEFPLVERRMHAELDTVLRGRLPTVQDLARLQYTRMVLDESLRIYPPVWFIAPRMALADDEIGGYEIPANSRVVVSPYTMHRHPQFWPNPNQFDPERFAPELSTGRPHYAFFPFGGGHHSCLGNGLAMIEGQLVLATVAQRYRLRLVPGHTVEAQPLVTLRHRYGLPMTLETRSDKSTNN